MKSNQTEFRGSTSLAQALEELEYNGLVEITRIMPRENGLWTFEYNIE